MSGEAHNLKSSPNDILCWETFHDKFIYSQQFSPEQATKEIVLAFRFVEDDWILPKVENENILHMITEDAVLLAFS